jgi:hypothetical protein
MSEVYRPFFFTKSAATGIMYLNMLQEILITKLKEDMKNFIFNKTEFWHISDGLGMVWIL